MRISSTNRGIILMFVLGILLLSSLLVTHLFLQMEIRMRQVILEKQAFEEEKTRFCEQYPQYCVVREVARYGFFC
jgi:hypothetical protein